MRPRRALGVCSVLVAMLLAPLPALPAGAASDQPSAGKPDERIASALEAARDQNERVAIPSRTTETTTVTANPDGTLTATKGLFPQRVRRDGGWVPLDLTLVRRDDGTVVPKAAPVDVRFSGATEGAARELAVVGKNDREVGIGWAGALPEPTLHGRTATYHDVFPGVNLLLTVNHFGFRQVLEVTNAESARDPRLGELAFRSHTRNVELRAGESSGIEATDESGAVVFRGDATRMWDSRGRTLESAADTAETTSGSPSRADMDVDIREGEVVVRPDSEFLTSPNRVFPVYIDPEYEWAGHKQNHVVVQSAWPGQQNYNRTDGDLSDLKAGVQGGYTSRSFFDFDVGEMHGKVIHAATVRTRVVHSWACGGPATQLWLTGGIWPSTTWNNQPSWSSKLDDITRSNHAQYCPSDGYAEANVLSAMREAAKGNWDRPTITFGLRAESGANEAWRRFALDPVLQVTYNSVPNVPGELGMEGGQLPCTTGEDRAFVPTSTSRLAARSATRTAAWWRAGSRSTPVRSARVPASGRTRSATFPPGRSPRSRCLTGW